MKRFIIVGLVVLAYFSPIRIFAQDLEEKAWNDFAYQLGIYRTSYEQFLIKRETFDRAQTFKANEELVAAAREMLIGRDMVWWTYFQGLRTQLVVNSGVTPEHKQPLEDSLTREQAYLSEHKTNLIPLTTRSELLTKAEDLNKKAPAYIDITYKNLIALKIGEMRFAVTSIRNLANRVKEAVTLQERDANLREVRLRGFTELETNLVKVEEGIKKEETVVNQYGKSNLDQSVYRQTTTKLTPIFEEIQQANQLLRELAFGVEL